MPRINDDVCSPFPRQGIYSETFDGSKVLLRYDGNSRVQILGKTPVHLVVGGMPVQEYMYLAQEKFQSVRADFERRGYQVGTFNSEGVFTPLR